jgi:hypothetical protein
LPSRGLVAMATPQSLVENAKVICHQEAIAIVLSGQNGSTATVTSTVLTPVRATMAPRAFIPMGTILLVLMKRSVDRWSPVYEG